MYGDPVCFLDDDFEDSLSYDLCSACRDGKLSKVKRTVESGLLDINHVNCRGHFPLKSASSNGNIEIVKYLISKGADVLNYDNIAIAAAAYNGHTDVVKVLIENGAISSYYALKWAVIYRHVELANYLISLGADITVRGNKLAKWAVEFLYPKVFKFLFGLVMDEMKKYGLLLLLNKNRIIHRDLFNLVKFVRYKKHYQCYQKLNIKCEAVDNTVN